LTGEEKLQFVQAQCEAMWEQRIELPFDCPYCYRTVPAGEEACCRHLALAVKAVIERMQAVDRGIAEMERREIRNELMRLN
jgi:hypothetical protein